MHVHMEYFTSCPLPLFWERGSLCVRVVMMESVVLLFEVLVKSEPQCLK